MKILKLIVVLFPFLMVSVACSRYTSHVYNVNQAQIITQHASAPSMVAVSKAIARAGSGLGWVMQDVRPGYTIATLSLRDHFAKVGISYDRHTYSIAYISSTNLMEGSKIHKNYNGWIKNLNKAIQNNLAAL